MAAEAGGPVKFLPVTHAAPPGIHLLLATRELPVTKNPGAKRSGWFKCAQNLVFDVLLSFSVHVSPGFWPSLFIVLPVYSSPHPEYFRLYSSRLTALQHHIPTDLVSSGLQF
ncbi:hypothetical protein E2C01_079812 [Portunus trituberculatus]|uniref:Uncharacterized protein n=1 Tax=Portunus trituberculatus TaxID=210409 RepID=A0A5B7IXZ4_PORTR|nr:hypothetical protein [Portunus trituberculatus]